MTGFLACEIMWFTKFVLGESCIENGLQQRVCSSYTLPLKSLDRWVMVPLMLCPLIVLHLPVWLFILQNVTSSPVWVIHASSSYVALDMAWHQDFPFGLWDYPLHKWMLNNFTTSIFFLCLSSLSYVTRGMLIYVQNNIFSVLHILIKMPLKTLSWFMCLSDNMIRKKPKWDEVNHKLKKQ